MMMMMLDIVLFYWVLSGGEGRGGRGADFAHFLDGFGLFFVIGTCYSSLFLYLLSMITY